MIRKLGERRAMLAVVLAGALVTYGGVSLFVAFFVLAPMTQALFRAADIPRRLMPAAIVLGTSTFTMSATRYTVDPECNPNAIFRHDALCCARYRHHCIRRHACFGLWWLGRAERVARQSGEGYGANHLPTVDLARDELLRERATTAREFDPAEIDHAAATAKLLRQSLRRLRRSSWSSPSTS